MIIGAQSFKLRELRAKTDRDLAALVNNQIETALKFQRLGLRNQARDASDEARALLQFVDATERRRLECMLSTIAEVPQVRTACSQ